jgi:hypothetical protein
MNTNTLSNQPPKLVYTVVQTKNGKSAWIKLGAGWINSDGSMNLKLDALPVNGTMQVRDNDRDQQRPFEDRRDLASLPFARSTPEPVPPPSREAFA